MASKLSLQCRTQRVLPCIGEDELLNQPASSSRGSISKIPQQMLHVNSESIVSSLCTAAHRLSVSNAKNTSVKSKDAVDGATGKGKMTGTNHREVTRQLTRRGSVPVGVSTEKDCYQGNAKTTKGSRNAKRQVKLNTPSPDVIDPNNEDVVKELVIRLYKTLRVQDNSTYDKFLMEDCTVRVEETSKHTKPNAGRRKLDSEINLFRHQKTRFPHVSKATSGLEVFYSKPVSWKSFISSRQLQPRIRARDFSAFQECSTKMNQEKMVQMNHRQLTWPFKDNYARPDRSTSVLRKRGLSVPFVVTNGTAFVSSKIFKASRKSVTFAE